MTHYLIYKITNLVNGKFYIGQHQTNDLDDGYFGSGLYLKQAIKKYGKENFIFEVLIDLKNEEEMNLLERLVVNEDFIKRDDVYNLQTGGHNGQPSLESRRKNSKAHLGKQPWNKGLTGIYSEETLAKISASRKGKCTGDDNPRAMSGKHHTDEVKMRIGKASRERPSGMKGKHHSKEAKIKMREKALGNRANSGMKWWNNGIENAMSFECPNGFVAGRLKRKKQ